MARSSSPPRDLSSTKLLFSEPKPKLDSLTAPPNSASSSSTTTAPSEKRTRDLPNLSDCHCCGRRINHTNPKDRLQPLDSVWRIVLLCRKCRKSVYSGQTCPYCLKGAENSGTFFKCSVCERKIHVDCVRDYGHCTPWCYLGTEMGVRVCVDCWVPESLKNSVRICGGSENKNVLKGKSGAKECLDKVAKDAKCQQKNRVKMAAVAKEQALGKTTVAKNTVDFTNEALSLESKKGKDGRKGESSDCSVATGVVDDAELAIQLHKSMNSSPRISRNKCMLKSSASDVMRIGKWKGISYKRSGKHRIEGPELGMSANSMENEINCAAKNRSSSDFNRLAQKLIAYKRDRKRKIWNLNDDCHVGLESMANHTEEGQLNLHSDDYATMCSIKLDADVIQSSSRDEIGRYKSEGLVFHNAAHKSSLIMVDRFGQNPIIYRRTKLRQKLCQINDSVGVSGSSRDENEEAIQSGDFESDDNRTGRQEKCEMEVILPNASCGAERDPYYLKYSKRVTSFKPDSSCPHFDTVLNGHAGTPALNNTGTVYSVKSDDEPSYQDGSSSAGFDRYCYKYAKRVKGCKSGEVAGSSPVLDRYCYKYAKRVKNCKSGEVAEIKLHSGDL